MKRSELGFTLALVPFDFLALLAAGIAAYSARFHPYFTEIRPVIFDLTLNGYVKVLIPIIIVWILVFAFSGLYSTHRMSVANELTRVALACSSSMAIVFAISFFSRVLFESRFIAIAAWGLAIVFVSITRLFVRALQRSLLRYGVGIHRVVIIGEGTTTKILTDIFNKKSRFGFRIVKHFKHFDSKTKSEIRTLKKNDKIDEILFADTQADRQTTLKLVSFADTEHLDFRYAADLFSAAVGRSVTHTYAGIPLIEVRKTPLDGWGSIYKRLFDILGSLALIILTSPIMIITLLAIVIDTGFPVIFKNKRVGRRGDMFETFKFRSMKKEFSIGSQKNLGDQKKALKMEQDLIKQKSKKAGPVYKILNDPRITRVGGVIRKYSIDELPNLFNVFFGSMSLVGPRPHQPREVEKYKDHHKRVLAIKPGITGMAQISGRSDLDFEDEVRLDTYYIEHWNPWLDLYVLFKTPLVVIFRKGAY